jgi:uncharacterized membrane protein YebE (DUF533 family)
MGHLLMRKGSGKPPAQSPRAIKLGIMRTAKPLLARAVADGRLDILECGKIETQLNKSVQNPYFSVDDEYLRFLMKEMKRQSRKA